MQIHRVSKTTIKDSNDFWDNSMKNENLSHEFPNKIVQFIWLFFIGSYKKGPISFQKKYQYEYKCRAHTKYGWIELN